MKTVFVETYAAISRRWTVYAYCEKCRSAFSGTSKMQLKHFNGVNGCVQWFNLNWDDSSLKLIFDERDEIQINGFFRLSLAADLVQNDEEEKYRIIVWVENFSGLSIVQCAEMIVSLCQFKFVRLHFEIGKSNWTHSFVSMPIAVKSIRHKYTTAYVCVRCACRCVRVCACAYVRA